MVAGRLAPGGGARSGRSRLRDVDPPELPGPGWVRVRPRLAGICGSDLATIDGTSSRYFEPIVSFPFMPGHEVVGDLDDGTRVVVVPVLGCVARGIDPLCDAVRRRPHQPLRAHRLRRTSSPACRAVLRATPAAAGRPCWSPTRASSHAVPDDLTDEAAVMVEPTACAVHAARAGRPPATRRA